MTNISIFSAIVLLFTNIYICNVNADTTSDNTALKSEAIDEYKKEIIENSKQSIEKSKGYFSCGGIGMIDHQVVFDHEVIFFKETSREFICTYSPSMCVSEIPEKDNTCTCPPPSWKSSGCWSKYTDILRSPK